MLAGGHVLKCEVGGLRQVTLGAGPVLKGAAGGPRLRSP